MQYYTIEHDDFTSVLTEIEFGSSEPRYDKNMFAGDPRVALVDAQTVDYGARKLLLEKHTGAWCFLESAEYDAYRSLDGMTLARAARRLPGVRSAELKDFVARLYWLNLLSLGGRRFIHPEVYRQGPITPPAPLFVIIPTERCNLFCKYCFSSSGPHGGPDMSWPTARRAVDLVMKYPAKRLEIDFNGGEAVLKIDLIEKIVNYARESARSCKKSVQFFAQTNGTLLTESMVERLKALDIFVGVSLDGDRPAHDAMRVYPNGKGTHAAIMKSLSIMDGKGLRRGVICVLSRANHRSLEGVLDFLYSAGFHWVKLNHVFRRGRAREKWNEYALSPAQFLEAHVSYLSYASARETFVTDWYVNYMIMNIGQKMHSFRCMRSQCGAGRDFFSFLPDGRVFPCDLFREREELALGHVREIRALHGLREAHPLLTRLFQRLPDRIAVCSECLYKRFCEAGCTLDAYCDSAGVDAPNPWCAYYQGMFKALFDKLAEGVQFARKICPTAKPFERIYFA